MCIIIKKINFKLLNSIIQEIKNNDKTTQPYLAKKYGYSERTIRRYFKILKNDICITYIPKEKTWKYTDDDN